MASPPVVKFLDFGQYKYELTKREKEAKRKQRSVTFKEVRLKPKIGIGDFDTKVRRAIQFLEEGDRIKVAVQFRGRELTHPEIGRSLLTRFAEQIKDHGVVERAPLLEGKSMHITVASIHKPKVVDHPTKHGHEDDEAAAEAGQTGATPVAPIAALKPTNGVETPAAAPAPAPAATAPAEPTEPAATTEPAADVAPEAKPAAVKPADARGPGDASGDAGRASGDAGRAGQAERSGPTGRSQGGSAGIALDRRGEAGRGPRQRDDDDNEEDDGTDQAGQGVGQDTQDDRARGPGPGSGRRVRPGCRRSRPIRRRPSASASPAAAR